MYIPDDRINVLYQVIETGLDLLVFTNLLLVLLQTFTRSGSESDLELAEGIALSSPSLAGEEW